MICLQEYLHSSNVTLENMRVTTSYSKFEGEYLSEERGMSDQTAGFAVLKPAARRMSMYFTKCTDSSRLCHSPVILQPIIQTSRRVRFSDSKPGSTCTSRRNVNRGWITTSGPISFLAPFVDQLDSGSARCKLLSVSLAVTWHVLRYPHEHTHSIVSSWGCCLRVPLQTGQHQALYMYATPGLVLKPRTN